jgi:hypothetical protein
MKHETVINSSAESWTRLTWLRWILFFLVLSAGSDMFAQFGWLPRDESFLVSGVIGALIFFLIPEPGNRRDRRVIKFFLLYLVVGYGICLKLQSLLAHFVGSRVATELSLLLFIGFCVTPTFVRGMRRPKSATDNPQ